MRTMYIPLNLTPGAAGTMNFLLKLCILIYIGYIKNDRMIKINAEDTLNEAVNDKEMP